ncbi:protein LNK1-like isoform X2 [Quillaja saponaria]|uniref:Protein LNK1-like isoform X2 n=1 Tax=Quillaja saponaria TaxID=32244 RepID=A0AAD7KX25_QUISA|nr:protein LNK1-like isoform X2 [Quillaja saponaria]
MLHKIQRPGVINAYNKFEMKSYHVVQERKNFLLGLVWFEGFGEKKEWKKEEDEANPLFGLNERTKLCIRDSLYRLAKSAERRHNCGGINGSIGDDVEARTMLAEDTNRCTGFMDMETNTNPIDRSIAHLLFHRPSDPSTVPANTSASL